MTENGKIKVYFLGNFRLETEKGCLTEKEIHSERIMRLLSYILLFRNKKLNQMELADVVWEDGEIGNPAGALKNLMYRLRNLMKEYLGKKEYILSGRGFYHWNPQCEVVLDAELLEEKIEKSIHEHSPEQAIEELEESMELYKGEFLETIGDTRWVFPYSAFYHNLMFKGTKKLIECCRQKGDDKKIENICEKLLLRYPEDEDLQYEMIESLRRQKKWREATEYAAQAIRHLEETMNVNPTRLKKLQENILKEKSEREEIQEIGDLRLQFDEGEAKGPLLCSIPVFKEMYHLAARKRRRWGSHSQVMLLTLKLVHGIGGVPSEEQARSFLLKKSMRKLENVLSVSLRADDIIARYSESQYILLLNECSGESAEIVSKRISEAFYRHYSGQRIHIKSEVLEIGQWM